MKKFGAVLAALGFAMAIGACGEPEGENQNTNGGEELTGTDAEVIEQMLTDAICEATFECYGDSVFGAYMAMQYGRYETVEECKANATFLEFADDPEFQAALDGERIIVDRSKASACKADFKASFCGGNFLESAPESCLELMDGQMAQGEPCVDEMECSGDLSCIFTYEEEGPCYGTCGPDEEVDDCGGEVCGDDQYCDGLYNDETMEYEEFCSAKVGEDEACSWDEQCAEGLRCSEIREICVAIETAQEGESCVLFETVCEPGTRCYPGDEPDLTAELIEGTCTGLGEAGESCVVEFDCKLGLDCEKESDEDFYGACVAVEEESEGEEGEMCVHPDDVEEEAAE